jgi:hypothetical protein
MPESPHFFVDRSLGRIRVPDRLRAEGWTLTTLAEHYGIPADEDIEDVEWLALAGSRGWPVLMKDDRIRRRPAEISALREAGVHAFCIANANLNAEQQIDLLLQHQQQIFQRCQGAGPTLDSVSKTGLRSITL